MIQRVNIIKKDGEYKLEFPNGKIPNWLIGIYNGTLGFMAFSKAGKGKEFAWRIKCQEGSLFLANNTNNFYWYFRERENQEILDRYGIIKVINTEFPQFELHLRYKDGKEINPIIKCNGNAVHSEEVSTNKTEKKYGVNTVKKVQCLVPYEGGYAIQKGKDNQSNVLYLYNITIKDFAELVSLTEEV